MRRLILVALIALIPAFLFLNVWQGYRYERLRQETARLEEEQKSWLERNKRLIVGISVLSSPERIEKIAREELGLKRIEPSRIMRVLLGEKGRGQE